MAFPKLYYEALEGIVGPEYISDDLAVCRSYMRGGEGVGMWDRDRVPPGVVVLPDNTEQVQGIVRVANRYNLPYVPIGTFMIAFCSPSRPNTIMIDPKRMNHLDIDAKNQMAVVEPYVTYSNLQAECFKYGLYNLAPLCGSQASVLANHLVFSIGQKTHRMGYGPRRILGLEWVLPNGELLRTGSLAIPGAGAFWGEGPGPDLRGMARGQMGHLGGMGVVTKMGIKLFAMPACQPERQGTNPNTTFSLPGDRLRWYVVFYDNLDQCINALYKVGYAEIGLAAMRVPALWRTLRKATSRNDFWQRWNKEMPEIEKSHTNVLRVACCGFASEKQLEYEERVLQDIADETGGTLTRTKQTSAGDFFQNGIAHCCYKPTGNYMSQKLPLESIDHCRKQVKESIHLKFALQPDLLIEDAKEEAGWVLSYDFGHLSHGEETTYFDNTEEDCMRAVQHELETIKFDIDHNSWPGWQLGWAHALFGPKMCNYHKLMEKVRNTFDPNWVSNPPRGYISMEEKKEDTKTYPYRPGWAEGETNES